jgi:uncharacterized protein YaaW (UPF0174 family)
MFDDGERRHRLELCLATQAAKEYQRYAARCLQEARTTGDFKFKTFLIEVAQAWQRLADQAKVVAALPNTPKEEPDRGD